MYHPANAQFYLGELQKRRKNEQQSSAEEQQKFQLNQGQKPLSLRGVTKREGNDDEEDEEEDDEEDDQEDDQEDDDDDSTVPPA